MIWEHFSDFVENLYPESLPKWDGDNPTELNIYCEECLLRMKSTKRKPKLWMRWKNGGHFQSFSACQVEGKKQIAMNLCFTSTLYIPFLNGEECPFDFDPMDKVGKNEGEKKEDGNDEGGKEEQIQILDVDKKEVDIEAHIETSGCFGDHKQLIKEAVDQAHEESMRRERQRPAPEETSYFQRT